jgi:Autoinducer binding domain
MHGYFDLSSEPTTPFGTFEEATSFLERATRAYGVSHLSYWLMTYSNGSPDDVVWVATYDPAYMSHYMSNYTPLGDPGFETALRDSEVLDWTDWIRDDDTSREMHQAAAKYGISKHGLSIPIRDESFGDVLFSVNVHCEDEDWIIAKGDILMRFRSFAHYFHKRLKPLAIARNNGASAFAA